MGEARSGQSDRALALDAGGRARHLRGAWHRRRRHQRRRPRRHPQRLRMVGAAREGDDRDVAVPSRGLRPSERPRRARRRRDVRVRRQRRRTQRRRDVAAGARVRARLVRAEARCRREDLVRAAHDLGQLRQQERRRRRLLRTAWLDLRRHERRRHSRFHRRQAVLLAQRELHRSRSLRRAGAVRLPDGSQQAGARRRASSCPSWCTTSRVRVRRCSPWISTRTA